MHPTTSTRPGGRTARTADAVLAATIDELARRPYAEVTVETIALAAGVHKTTLYRRWGSKEELVRQALVASADANIAVPDTGRIDSDLRMLGRSVRSTLLSRQGAAVTTSVLVAAAASPVIREVVQQLWRARREVLVVVVERAVGRGELPAGTDPARLLEAMVAPLYYRLLVAGTDVTPADADLGADAALVAARAGLFTR